MCVCLCNLCHYDLIYTEETEVMENQDKEKDSSSNVSYFIMCIIVIMFTLCIIRLCIAAEVVVSRNIVVFAKDRSSNQVMLQNVCCHC